jgi:hypothetical protein
MRRGVEGFRAVGMAGMGDLPSTPVQSTPPLQPSSSTQAGDFFSTTHFCPTHPPSHAYQLFLNPATSHSLLTLATVTAMPPHPQPDTGATSNRDQAAVKSKPTAGTQTTVSKDLPPTPYRAMPRSPLSTRRTHPQGARKRSHTAADTNARPELEKNGANGRPLKKARPAVTVGDRSPSPRAGGSAGTHRGVSCQMIRLTTAGCP